MAEQPINRQQLEYHFQHINTLYGGMKEIPKWDLEKVEKRMEMIQFSSQILMHHYHKFDLDVKEYIAYQDGVAEILTACKKRQKELAEKNKSEVADHAPESTVVVKPKLQQTAPIQSASNCSKPGPSNGQKFDDQHYKQLLESDDEQEICDAISQQILGEKPHHVKAPVLQNKGTFDRSRPNYNYQPKEAHHSNRPNSQINNKFQFNPKAPAFVGKPSRTKSAYKNNNEDSGVIYPPPNVPQRQSNAANGANFNRGGGGGFSKFLGQQ